MFWGDVCQYNTLMLSDACQNTILVSLLLIRYIFIISFKTGRFRSNNQLMVFTECQFLYSPRKPWEEIKAFNNWYVEDAVKS